MQLDVESLRTFLAVLEHGGMTRAAAALQMSQSAVSWKIKRLEARVGRPLLIREGHSIRPSRDGLALIADARTIVEAHDRAAARLRDSEIAGLVRFGANEEIAASRMTTVLGGFNRLHAAATVEVRIANSDALARLLDAGDLDVAVMQVAIDERRPGDVVLWNEHLAWVTGWETPYEEGPVPLVTFGEYCAYRRLYEPYLRRRGIDYTVAFASPSSAAVRGAVAAGLGVAVLGTKAIGDNWRDGLGDEIVEWTRGADLGDLPEMYQIVRTAPGDPPEVVEALVESIVAALGDPVAA